MKKLLIITMIGLLLSGVGCSKKNLSEEDIINNRPKLEDSYNKKNKSKNDIKYQESDNKENLDDAVDFIENKIGQNYQIYGFNVNFAVQPAYDENTIIISMYMSGGEGVTITGLRTQGFADNFIKEGIGYQEYVDELSYFANIVQSETRKLYGDNIYIITSAYLNDEPIYTVDGNGKIIYDIFN